MIRNILSIVFLLYSCLASSQSITYFKGKTWTPSYVVLDAIGSYVEIDSRKSSRFSISYPVTDKLELSLSYWDYGAFTQFYLFNPDAEIYNFYGHGSARIFLKRYGLGINYPLVNFKNVIVVNAAARIEYESTDIYSDFSVVKIFDLANNDIEGYFPGVATVRTYPGTQVLPSIGFRIDLHLFWRITLHAQYDWTFGHRVTQSMYFDYSYYGEAQPTAEWYTDGTMHIEMLGISLKFWGDKEKPSDKVSFF